MLHETHTSPLPLLCYKVHLIESTLPKENKMVILACRSKRTSSITVRGTASLKSLETMNDRWANLGKILKLFMRYFRTTLTRMHKTTTKFHNTNVSVVTHSSVWIAIETDLYYWTQNMESFHIHDEICFFMSRFRIIFSTCIVWIGRRSSWVLDLDVFITCIIVLIDT